MPLRLTPHSQFHHGFVPTPSASLSAASLRGAVAQLMWALKLGWAASQRRCGLDATEGRNDRFGNSRRRIHSGPRPRANDHIEMQHCPLVCGTPRESRNGNGEGRGRGRGRKARSKDGAAKGCQPQENASARALSRLCCESESNGQLPHHQAAPSTGWTPPNCGPFPASPHRASRTRPGCDLGCLGKAGYGRRLRCSRSPFFAASLPPSASSPFFFPWISVIVQRRVLGRQRSVEDGWPYADYNSTRALQQEGHILGESRSARLP